MRLIFRAVLALLVSLTLSGCNMVISEQPWFSAADTAGAPLLRDGLWVRIDGSEECRVKLQRPAHTWPDCANPIVIRGGEWHEPNWAATDRGRKGFAGWQPIPVLLAAGDPAILQLFQTGEAEGKGFYLYLGARPLAASDGRVSALAFWLVQCGPMDPETTDNRNEVGRQVTSRPFAGLTMKDDDCTADSSASLRNAARQSEGLGLDSGEKLATMRWVRDSWP